MPFIFNFARGVPEASERAIRKLAATLSKLTEIRHPLPVFVVAEDRLQDASRPYGVFWFCESDRTGRIELAGKGPLDEVLDTFAHELAHYEQWRDGKPVQERGVSVRAKSLLRLASTSATTASSRRPSKAKTAGGSAGTVRRKRA